MQWACFSLAVIAIASPVLRAATYNCTTFDLPGGAVANGINNAGAIAGTVATHGFIRDAQGNVTLIDYPGAASTTLTAINNNGIAVGSYTLAPVSPANSGPAGWFTVDSQGNFAPVQLPASGGAPEYVYGINDNGAISGVIEGMARVPSMGQIGSPPQFFILSPQQTATFVSTVAPPGYPSFPGDLNLSGQMLEISPAPIPGFTGIRNSDNTVTPIYFPHPLASAGAVAYGLNNLGEVAGYVPLGAFAGASGPPYAGFLRDASGSLSELICGGDSTFRLAPRALNDNGIIVGGGGAGVSIATPVPGNPQLSISAVGVNFGTVISGQSTPAQTVTLRNTGDTRLDIGGIEMNHNSDFTVSLCMRQGAAALSLAPGESCDVSVAPVLSPARSGAETATLAIDDSAAGAPHAIPVAMFISPVVPPPPPSCNITGSPGPPGLLTFAVQDANSGLQSISVDSAANATVNLPSFAVGSTAPVIVTANQTDPSLSASVQLGIRNAAGTAASCGSVIAAGPPQWSGSGGVLIGGVAVAANLDGRLEAFGVGTDHALWHIAQTVANGPWGGWSSLGFGSFTGVSAFVGDPSVGTNADGRLDAFVLDSGNELWSLTQSTPGNWSSSAWQATFPQSQGRPATALNLDGRLQLFIRTRNDSLAYLAQDPPGSDQFPGLTDISHPTASNPAAVLDSGGLTEVFVVEPGGALATNSQIVPSVENWGSWSSLGGYLKGDPAAVATSNALFVFGRGGDDALWFRMRQGSTAAAWSDWSSLGGTMIGSPVAAVNSDGRVDVFAIGADHGLWHIAQNPDFATWSSWQKLGGFIPGNAVTMVRDSSALLNGFVVGGDLGVWQIQQTLPGWWLE